MAFQVHHFRQPEDVEFMRGNPAGKRLRGLAEEFRRGAPQDQEVGRGAWTIGENAQELEDPG